MNNGDDGTNDGYEDDEVDGSIKNVALDDKYADDGKNKVDLRDVDSNVGDINDGGRIDYVGGVDTNCGEC